MGASPVRIGRANAVSAEELGDALRVAHRDGRPIAAVPRTWCPATVDEAYRVASHLTQGRGRTAGWKIGATAPAGQGALGLDEPFYGRVFAESVYRSPALVPAVKRVFGFEPEPAFVIGRTLMPRVEPYTSADLRGAVAAFAPALEIVWPAFEQPMQVGGLCLIADNGVNAGAVLGDAKPVPAADELRDLHVRVMVDGVETATGRADRALGDPLAALVWLANTLRTHGLALEQGQFVCVGALTPPTSLRPGSRVEADFGRYGRVIATAAA